MPGDDWDAWAVLGAWVPGGMPGEPGVPRDALGAWSAWGYLGLLWDARGAMPGGAWGA